MNRNKEVDLKFVNEYQPFKDKVQLRIMLYGSVGAGKSSFMNSVESVLRGKITDRAAADALFHGGKYFSLAQWLELYKAYKIRKGGLGTHYPFVFNDIMGLGKDAERGVCVEDIKLAMKGHMEDGYKFNPSSALSEDNQHYNRDPSINDRVHVLVCVIPGNTAGLQNDNATSQLPTEGVKKLRENYHSEIDTSDDTDTLILSALRRMIESGEHFVNDL
ncbi:hypothetical protein NQZ68_005517 [Dissostichus eleginoides]|nr:hypothetical protein NQZ68_005517 [Dissostichus eleginoides]